MHDERFEAMGSRVRLLIGGPGPEMAAAEAAADARRFVGEFDAALSRFRPESELCALNASPRERVPASPLLRAALRAGLRAARLSDGLVDPTLVDQIEAVGYAASRAGLTAEIPLAEALRAAPRRRPAAPDPAGRWRRFRLDDEAETVARPPGLRFDTGGTGKGLAADLLAARLRGYSRFLVDCGGDIRIGGDAALVDPFDVFVAHPLRDEPAFVLRLGAGAVATSGLDVRIWRDDHGDVAHHLLDPASGKPAWTGLVGATALGGDAVEAEALAKLALLSGPRGARAALAERGGLIVHDNGRVETVGPLAAPPRLRLPDLAAA